MDALSEGGQVMDLIEEGHDLSLLDGGAFALIARRHALSEGAEEIQGYLAHKKQPPPRTLP